MPITPTPQLPLRMTSTTLMPVRVSLRRDPNGAPDQLDVDVQPPSKRPRLSQPASRRRRSSPDLLDTTSSAAEPSAATSPYRKLSGSSHHQPLRRRTSARRPLASSPSPSTPRPTTTTTSPSSDRRILRNDSIPATTPAPLYLHANRESPDPLDTISPSATKKASVLRRLSPAGRPSAAAAASARRPRRPAPAADTTEIEIASTPTRPEIAVSASSEQKPSRSSRNAAAQQPAEQAPAARESRRSLRSHDGGSRARSELALYFPNYEELLSLEPPKTEFLAGNTTLKLIDDLPAPFTPSSLDAGADSDLPFGNPLLNLHNCETITLPDPPMKAEHPTPESNTSEPPSATDPLSEDTYFRPHRRNERQEKQLRNIERDRAQHEKQNLDRLLDELQGHDWLRVMGITGLISDPERKHYESKRSYFIREISAVLQKFKIWKEEERRRKLEKDKPVEVEDGRDQNKETPETNDDDDDEEAAGDSGIATLSDAQSYGDPPDPNDVDAWAARQLHQEARSATTTTTAATSGKKFKPASTSASTSSSKKPSSSSSSSSTMPPPPPAPIPMPFPPPPSEPLKPFTSFYAKPHLRELALSTTHRKNRTRLAFGHPIPDMEEQEFSLPPDILTAEAIDSCRRKRRRMRRASGSQGEVWGLSP
ncbi:hypothetical protein BO70DRAFT_426925 [Aspergillus heteromorphus CBS 117.55]|uniref:Something about silencing protein 4 domain-containing protein n=1 Tax=Aspergillus heteromorphus CBS 117.55 TaxID=1448321 RepID=A0A317WU07_9EURO|nr:uncharacterized protein BO70DRAFT_426925 [Aspergillus heteromorphus CBS 117.55]PWY89301.1 hypothetical protein BO70DRAFT_426925 [Aspergillus heteromorphus CBS 117.55]